MAKGKANKIALDNLKGFFQIGAETNIPGYIPTGRPKLDFALHYGEDLNKIDLSTVKGYDPSKPLGLPLGRMVEIFGKPGSGKSSLAYATCANAQKLGYRAVWIDAEQSFSKELAVINGVDVSEENQMFLMSDLVNKQDAEQIYAAEDVFNNIIEICKMNAKGANIGVVVVDSVASLVPRSVMDSNAEDLKPGALARLMAENLKKVGNYAAKFGVLVIFINQIREKIGVLFGNPETTPGGHSLEFQSTVRLRVVLNSGKDQKHDIVAKMPDGSERKVGRNSRVTIEKNRLAKPYKEPIDLAIYYEEYFRDTDDLLFEVGRKVRVIGYRLATYKWRDIEVKTIEEFWKHVEIAGLKDELIREIAQAIEEKGQIVPPELATLFKDALEAPVENVSDEVADEETEDGDNAKAKLRRGRKKQADQAGE